MQRGSDRMSPHRDDEMKRELQGLLRSGHPTRVEEWHDPEPAADDDPELHTPRVPAAGGGADPLAYELARHVGRRPFPARRGTLLRALHEHHAPDRLVDLVKELPPDVTYGSVHEVADDLRGGA
ncbi:DUF2795 domain-containing protein [Streptomyces sp. B1866]|uniref:DUF2795 domain-containing protein n=1 Tax=Streptomyces sp. B1866 TaxID=3075431 RepID=UPI0028907A1C|nr:DUF2795 domain-containing protein [Streptomyces sp. B1866]MDT3397911.1 DUF2795 domain-containing protein [Streptomyces sp. B1866]